ncbi:MAG: DegV family protein [Firmicutes bacterium]|nr:DegV family protein [Bacillota bacterium]
MEKVKIITDSCSDLTHDLMEKYDIDYVRMNTVFEGKTSPAILEWSPEDVHDFYGIMRSGKRITTTQVPVCEFNRIFSEYLKKDTDIVYIACSSKQSGSVNTAHVLAEQFMKEYPGRTIECIDSLNASMGEGMLAIEAAKLAADGMSAHDIAENVSARRKKINEFVTVHSLDALRRAGRVKGPAAFFGNLMGVKPIIISDVNGEQAAYKKVKGRQSSINEIVALLKEAIIDPEEQTVYIAHADCAENEVEQLKSKIKQEIPCKDVYVGYIGPIIGASIGPDALAVFGMGKEVTFKIGE